MRKTKQRKLKAAFKKRYGRLPNKAIVKSSYKGIVISESVPSEWRQIKKRGISR